MTTTAAAPDPTTTRLRPRDTATEPDLAALLDRLDLGTVLPDSVESYLGRNDNWSGSTSGGQQVFVKRIVRSRREPYDRFDRSVSFENLRRTHGVAPAAPDCLGWDDETGLMAFAFLAGCRSGSELATDQRFDADLARRAGELTAALHAMPTDGADLDTSPAPLPDLGWLTALPLEVAMAASFAQLEAVRLIRDDEQVATALRRLRTAEADAPRVAVHGDLRLDQFLVADGRVLLCDWEEFRLGDPARDLGGFAGECLYRAVVGIVERPAEPVDDDVTLSPKEIIARGVAGLRRQRPLVEAFCAGYRETLPIDGQTAARAAAFAGWHMFDRLYSSGHERPRLSAIHRAAAGIGRTVLLDPAASAGLLGLRR